MTTSTPHQTSRRQALKFLATAPMLPLGLGSASLMLGGCASTGAASLPGAGKAAAISFTSMAAPSLANPAAMATTTVASSMQVTLQDGTTRTYKLAYQPFFITGDEVPDGHGGTALAGGYVDILSRPIMDKSVPG
ncbi:MAG: alkaline phosphatase, partial [Rhodoferax sp.]|nr:alkaline phosphatase [Rhodoferax sp.]